ncbi:MAG: hypothetical protein Q4C47_01430 [Planctomycetia bacterium]|nr:hypothetical protein [Planctomycetia bacterium]
MKRTEPDENEGGISLFPFLAVLLCTMGALLVLLVVLSHQAHERRRAEMAMRTTGESPFTLSSDGEKGIVDGTVEKLVGKGTDTEEPFPDLTALRQELTIRSESLARSRIRLTELNRELRELDRRLTLSPESTIPPPDSGNVDLPDLSGEIEILRSESDQLWTQLRESQELRQRLLTRITEEERSIASLRTRLESTSGNVGASPESADGAPDPMNGVPDTTRIASTAETVTEQEPVWSIIPYAGPGGVRKRPIYLECRHDGIVLQPDGIRFTRRDFTDDLSDPDTPLLVAVRIAEVSMRPSVSDGTSAPQPYLLLLVRPDGIASYYVARTALQGYPAELGYELLGENWKLTCPESDPGVTSRIQNAVAMARQRLYRHQMIAAIEASGEMSTVDPTTLLADTESSALPSTLSFVPASVDRSTGGSPPGPGPGRFSDTGNLPGGDVFSGNGSSGRERFAGNGEDVLLAGIGTSSGVDTFPGGGEDRFGGDRFRGTGIASREMVPNGTGINPASYATETDEMNRFGRTQRHSGDTYPPEIAGNPENGVSGTETLPESGVFPGTESLPGTEIGGNGGGGTPDGPGHFGKTSGRTRLIVPVSEDRTGPGEFDDLVFGDPGRVDKDAPEKSTDRETEIDYSSVSPGSGASGRNSGEEPSEESSGTSAPPFRSSLASTRGKNWGLPDAVRAMSPVWRPIRATLTTECLRLQRNPETRRTPEISLTGSMSAAMDDLVTAVWDHQRSWGFAGRRMYWKPTLSVEVTPGAEQRFRELCELMEDSGIELRRADVSSR